MATLTRTLAASAVAALTVGTLGAVAAPASAGNGPGGGHSGGGPLSLTRSAAATLDKYDVDLEWNRPGKANRAGGDGHDHNGVTRLRGTLVFDGDDANTTWAKIRINDRTNRVTAIVNGGERRAVLKFRDGKNDRFDGRGHHRTVLRLTAAGANSIDRAAGADAFDAGDAFAKAGKHRGHHH